jgi:hypothetical protein
MSVLQTIYSDNWDSPQFDNNVNVTEALESGNIIFLPQLQFQLYSSEISLISPIHSDGIAKNISMAFKNKQIKGLADKNNTTLTNAFTQLLERFALQSTSLLTQLVPAYKNKLDRGRTSFRPVEIQGRKAPSYRKDDTRLHVDAFPANPNQGKRILRVFCNIHPEGKPRCWRVGASFSDVACTFLPKIRKPFVLSKQILKLLKITKSDRTVYDHIMLNIHNMMKKDMEYQSTIPYTEINFPAQSVWIVFTDSVSHAALSGQHILEQTFYLDVNDMENPSLSPLKILEKMTGQSLT